MSGFAKPDRKAKAPPAKASPATNASARAASPNNPHPAGGLPAPLRWSIEALAGVSMGDVRVHYNSAKPARVSALAYAQGRDIYLGTGQERYLAHEAWHVVQQKQRRVKVDTRLGRLGLNTDATLEREADAQGARALALSRGAPRPARGGALGRTPQAAAGGHQPIVQRYLQVGQDIIRPSTKMTQSDLHALRRALDLHLAHLGFKLSQEGAETLIEWCDAPGLAPRAFHDVADLAAAFLALGLTYSSARGPGSTGPSSLGKRPTFSGEANALEYGQSHGDTARRHVIASSTLGLAIETSQTTLDEINGFLVRHGRQAVPDNPRARQGQIQLARRQAWELVHNHVGNLWVGPSPINTAIGFIRGAINKIVHQLSSGEPLLSGDVARMAITPQGPMDRNAQAEWFGFAAFLNEMVTPLADQHGVLDAAEVLPLLNDFARNADLDIPQNHPNGFDYKTYQANLRQVYAQILGAIMTGNPIFEKGGTLDQYMALDAGTRPPAPKGSGAKVDGDGDVDMLASTSAAKIVKAAEEAKGKIGDSKVDGKSGALTSAERLHLLAQAPEHVDGLLVRNVSGEGMDCLIRSLLVAAGHDAYAHNDPNNVVATVRTNLIARHFAFSGQMLDLAGVQGAAVISDLVNRGLVGAGRGVVIYHRNARTLEIDRLPVLHGADPLKLWLSGAHFRAIR